MGQGHSPTFSDWSNTPHRGGRGSETGPLFFLPIFSRIFFCCVCLGCAPGGLGSGRRTRNRLAASCPAAAEVAGMSGPAQTPRNFSDACEALPLGSARPLQVRRFQRFCPKESFELAGGARANFDWRERAWLEHAGRAALIHTGQGRNSIPAPHRIFRTPSSLPSRFTRPAASLAASTA